MKLDRQWFWDEVLKFWTKLAPNPEYGAKICLKNRFRHSISYTTVLRVSYCATRIHVYFTLLYNGRRTGTSMRSIECTPHQGILQREITRQEVKVI